MTRTLACCLSLALFAAPPAWAGAVYVPLPGYAAVGSAAWEPTVLISNRDAQVATYVGYFIAENTDGAQRTGEPTSAQIGGRATSGLAPEPPQKGLLEISAPPSIATGAWLADVASGASVQLPVIGSHNLVAAGDRAYLQGLVRSGGWQTDLFLVNLEHVATDCTLTFLTSAGQPIGSPVVIGLKALSLRVFPDVLDTLALSEASAVRGESTCDRAFFVFALVRDEERGRVSYLAPSGRGSSTLVRPGDNGGGGDCPAGAICFDLAGVQHSPTKSSPVKRLTFPVAAGTYHRIHLAMDVKHGGWNSANSKGLHEIFWLVKNRNFLMYGYANLRGPSLNTVLFRHGVELTHPQKVKIEEAFKAEPGKTYHYDYVYDTKAHFLELVISEGSREVHRLRGVPNVDRIAVAPGDNLLIDLGFDGSNPNELPTYGWVYSDVHLDLIP